MIHIRKGLRRPVEAMAEDPDGKGWSKRVVGYEVYDVELLLDLEGLATELGRAAARNKSGRSIGQFGLIKAKVINRKREV